MSWSELASQPHGTVVERSAWGGGPLRRSSFVPSTALSSNYSWKKKGFMCIVPNANGFPGNVTERKLAPFRCVFSRTFASRPLRLQTPPA